MVSPGCHIKLTKYAFRAGEVAMACGMPSTSRFGITLVNSDPGPRVMRSASAMARSVSARGLGLRGRSVIRSMRDVLGL